MSSARVVWLRLAALFAAYVAGTWMIVLLVGAPLTEALSFPFLILIPYGLVPMVLGCALVWGLAWTGQRGLVAHVLGALVVPLLSFAVYRVFNGGAGALKGMFEAPGFLAVLVGGGILAGVVLWWLRRRAGDI